MKKKVFIVEVIETLQKSVPVMAESAEQAQTIVDEAYGDGDIVLDSSSFVDHEVTVVENPVERVSTDSATILLRDGQVLELSPSKKHSKTFERFYNFHAKGLGNHVSKHGTVEEVLPEVLERFDYTTDDIIAKFDHLVNIEGKVVTSDDE